MSNKYACALMHVQQLDNNHVHKLISVPCCLLPSSIYSHLSIGVFQRRLLLPPPKNEIWPLLQYASRKLPLMYMCVCVCVCSPEPDVLYICRCICFQCCLVCVPMYMLLFFLALIGLSSPRVQGYLL